MILAFMRAVLLGKSRVGSRSRSGISGVILHNPIRDLLESKPYNDRSNFPRFQCEGDYSKCGISSPGPERGLVTQFY